MPPKAAKKGARRENPAEVNFHLGYRALSCHPMFAPLLLHAHVTRCDSGILCPKEGWAVVTRHGRIEAHPKRLGQPEEWTYVLAHCLLHLGFGHFQERRKPMEWNAACDCFVAKFLADLKLGRPPQEMRFPVEFTARSEERLYEEFCEGGIPATLQGFGTAGSHGIDMVMESNVGNPWGYKTDWPSCFGQGLSAAVTSAVRVAAGEEPYLGADERTSTPARRARDWFISSYPLLGALASAFDIVEDPVVCARLDISVAAVDEVSREIFMNPAAGMDDYESRFVMGHELLHVGLRHLPRQQGRDPYLWNVACDYVMNGLLVEMVIGELPSLGSLYDPDLKGESAESVYDRILTDMRRYRKLATLLAVLASRGHPG
ncbi:MAG: peptidase, partial [Armatimonadetes bacterium]|nr:peptidase [Armatimonadota bacterium]